jgi:hypothetical protein
MLGVATICCAIWKARNKICFEKNTYKKILMKFYTLLARLCAIGHVYTRRTLNRSSVKVLI